MFRILTPAMFVTAPWKNGGGITHEVARQDAGAGWAWRISIAEVASDGPFSRFDGLQRILTVIDGAGIDLHTPLGTLRARRGVPVRFSGDLAVDSRMVAGPVRDLNVIFDPLLVAADVSVLSGPARIMAGPVQTGVLGLCGPVTVAGQTLPVGAFALGEDGAVDLGPGAMAVLVRLHPATPD